MTLETMLARAMIEDRRRELDIKLRHAPYFADLAATRKPTARRSSFARIVRSIVGRRRPESAVTSTLEATTTH